MEDPIEITGTGYVATDGSTYATLALLNAAAKTAWPPLAAQGIYPANVVLTSVADGGGSGQGYQFRTNTVTPPSIGVPVQAGGQQFVVGGLNGITKELITNLYVLNKDDSDDSIFASALYA